MNTRKPATPIAPETLVRLGQEIKRSLNFSVGPDGRGLTLHGPEIGLLAHLDRIVQLTLETTVTPFRICSEEVEEPDASGWPRTVSGQPYVKTAAPNSCPRAIRELATCLTTIRANTTTLDPSEPVANRLQYAPHIGLLVKVLFDHPISTYQGFKINALVGDTGRLMAELYNDFVAQFRQSMLDRKLLRRERHNWELGSRENAEKLHAYLDDLFEKHGSLTVLHLRLFHARERASLLSAATEEQHLDLGALRECRTRFFDRMRRKPGLFTNEPGYVWAILPSLVGGYDMHLTLLFDTAALQKVLDDKRVEAEHTGAVLEDYADQVGGYWVKGATGGRGSYLRGDQNGWLYGRDWVHGEVRANDPPRRGKLKEMLSYLAMRRALVRLTDEPSGVYFGMPDRKARSPRRSDKTDLKPR